MYRYPVITNDLEILVFLAWQTRAKVEVKCIRGEYQFYYIYNTQRELDKARETIYDYIESRL